MTDTIAVVTGAAGGIGEAVARALSDDGTTVALLDRNLPALRTLSRELTRSGHPHRVWGIDITDAAQTESTVAEIERELGPVDYLVNAAGILRPGPVVTFDDADWAATFAVNTTGTFQVSRSVARRSSHCARRA